MNRTLVVAAHPDDEILGCGGAVARRTHAGGEVRVLILAEGVTSRDASRDVAAREDDLKRLHQVAQRANRKLGVRHVTIESFPDNRLDSVPLLDVVKAVERALEAFDPQEILTHFGNDLNVDHRVVQQAVITAARPVPGQNVRRILLFETPSSTEWQVGGQGAAFQPNWFEPIEPFLTLKLEALEEYAEEMRPWPHARSLRAVESLANWRGASVGLPAAEAFQLARQVVE